MIAIIISFVIGFVLCLFICCLYYGTIFSNMYKRQLILLEEIDARDRLIDEFKKIEARAIKGNFELFKKDGYTPN